MQIPGLVSVIVPVYNAEKYLDKCIQSIVGQTYKKIEICLVDDGSVDKSAEICEKWASKDSRILVIHKKNGGVSSARNTGLDNSKGEFIAFVDADDWLADSYLSVLINNSPKSDIVIGGYNPINESSIATKSVGGCLISLDSLKMDFDRYYEQDLINPPFSKLFRHDIVGIQRFNEDFSLGEDLEFNLKYLTKCKAIHFVSDSLYYYNIGNSSSASKRLRDNDFEQIYKMYIYTKGFVNKKGIIDFDAVDKRFCHNVIGLLQLLYYSNIKGKNQIATQWISNKEFNDCCNGKYGFGIKDRIPQFLCKNKNEIGLAFFYKVKKTIRKILK